ncbi:hypothetical protein FB561_2681 [Kribbella amoyensis]|uniref:Uncharacterized protein n=1 Tax=Kribbella amoyensis TaxID=996641 RepID=A0A561BRQ3_9ACTN|nr:hypothetical protein [Kribbella amoyensis]TWD81565.1 hypothetical protein FB561_2681 [Kribbella amoyensis]
MSSRAGETFDAARAGAEVRELLEADVPADGPASADGDPVTGEWTVTTGPGFRIVPLWEGEGLTGVYGNEWTDAADTATGYLEALGKTLETGWGPYRKITIDGALIRWQMDQPVDPLFDALFSVDLYGDLHVWQPRPDRWVAATVGHSDGDAPLVLAALVTDRPIPEPEGP